MSLALKNGFTPMIPPALVKPQAMEGTGFLGQAAQDVYHLAEDDLYLVGTAEVPLAAYHSDEILAAAPLPLRYAGYSPSYRREAGSYGKDTRGIFRVHWFDKVEMFVFCAPEDAAAEHQRLLGSGRRSSSTRSRSRTRSSTWRPATWAERGAEVRLRGWLPTQERYREITSTSNCTEFQARRLQHPGPLRRPAPAGGDAERHALRDDHGPSS